MVLARGNANRVDNMVMKIDVGRDPFIRIIDAKVQSILDRVKGCYFIGAWVSIWPRLSYCVCPNNIFA